MAEQISHNVVNESQSTSASALVDVAANQTNTASAEHGDQTEPSTSATIPEIKSLPSHAPPHANEHAMQADELSVSLGAGTGDHAGAADDTVATRDIAVDDGAKASSPHVHSNDAAAPVTDVVADDVSVREGSVDISLNSDTEGSRDDSLDLKKDDKYHVRTNSAKKPLTFSKVSVTKNFLAKSVNTAPPVAKQGDRPSPAGTPPQAQAAKPRLIAKVGTSLRDVQKARLSADAAGGPDASKVWNKNRPVPPPPPKQFTDEELKQQYGIHLATRLQTDEEGKQSKWADIDDDEEDWAPDTVEWMDGTKSSLTSHEATQPPQKDQKLPVAVAVKPTEILRPTLIVRKPGESGASMTVLKPGANAATAQPRQGESGSGNNSEKALEVGRSPAALPSKSPWAVLPPVDKISPVNPPVQQRQLPTFATQDARVLEQLPPQGPAREIAADTFDRSWREGEGGTRELFNSANGRYEPVQEGRRGSVKPDSSYKKPAVLQRPSQNSMHPAEPSAAFQTRTSSQHDSSWTRRRGSSVSQSSLPQGRRMSTPKASEASPVPERRTSTVIGHDLRASPKAERADPAPPTFSQQSAWQQQMPPRPADEEDPVKVQERIMREKREEARKRREEEARLEAEKKERLKAKLASLSGAGKSRKEREAEAAAAVVSATVAPTGGLEFANETTPRAADEDAATRPTSTDIPTKAAPALEPQASAASAEHVHAEPLAQEPPMPSPIPQKQTAVSPTEYPEQSADQDQRQTQRAHPSPRANARAPFQQSGTPFKVGTSAYSAPGERKQQPFERSPLANTGTFSPWGTSASTGNVWGTSGIGNGTFESSNVFAPVPMSQQSSLPPPPGMPRASGSTRISSQSLALESRSPKLQQQSAADSARMFGPPGLDSRVDAFAANQERTTGASPASVLSRQTHLPGPIAPPSRTQQSTSQQAAQRQASLAAWNNAVHTLPNQYKVDAQVAEQRAKDSIIAARDDTFRETFKQTSTEPGRLGAPRRFENMEYTIHDAQGSRSVQSLSPAPLGAQSQPVAPLSLHSHLAQDGWKNVPESTVRIPDGSLNPAHGGMRSHPLPIGPPSTQKSMTSPYKGPSQPSAFDLPNDESQPPPETMSHPVYSSESGHPHVKLPPKKPTVKLPPTQGTANPLNVAQQPTVMPHRPSTNWGPPGSARPLVMQEAWQARFNGLFNRTPIQTETPPSPPKTPPKTRGPALAVSSSSRVVMAETASNATVSLPPGKKAKSASGFIVDESADIVSKGMIEQIFLDELSFGFAPKVQIPRGSHYRPPQLLSKHSNVSMPARIEATSRLEFNMLDLHTKNPSGLFVHLSGTRLIRKLVRHSTGQRLPSGLYQQRKSSGRAGDKRQDSHSQAGTGTSNPQSRKTSFRKTSPLAISSAATASSPTGKEPNRKASWAKPPKGRRVQPPPVQAA